MRPRVGVSRCLLGDAVRYDGGHKRDEAVLALGALFELVAVCPEVEVGMPVPRPSIDRVGQALLDPGGRDWAPEMRAWASPRLDALAPLDGFVLKRRSPSCGPDRPGLFAEMVRARWPSLPLTDEAGVDDAFVGRVCATFSARTRVPIAARTVRELLEVAMIDRKARGKS